MVGYYKLHIQSSSLVVVNKLRATVRAQDNSWSREEIIMRRPPGARAKRSTKVWA